MLISPQHRFIFFKPLKCAGSSVEFSLLKHCSEHALCTGGTPGEVQMGYVELNNHTFTDGKKYHLFNSHTWPALFFERIANTAQWNDYKKISIVRNPWDTVVSWYWWSMYRLGRHSLLIDEKDDDYLTKLKFGTFLKTKGFIDSITPETLPIECTPLEYIDINENFLDSSIDYYVRFENLQKDYDNLCNQLKLKNSKLHKLKGTHRKIKRHYSRYYSLETQSMVAKHFVSTIKHFNYTFVEHD